MTIKQYLAFVALLTTLFAGAAYTADAAYNNISQALVGGELVIAARRDPVRWGAARCNDGTPFAFVVDRSPSDSPLWVIYLQGGQFCDDNALMCSERSRNLTTALEGSDGSAAMMLPHDLLSRDAATNPTLYNANYAFGHYCSSDLWSGNSGDPRPTMGSAAGWYFTGRINVRAMVEILKDRYGLDDSNPQTQVLFAGSSAGGVGVIVNADSVAALLPNTASSKRLRLVVDGGYFPEFANSAYSFGDAPASLPDILQRAYDFWGSALNPACEQGMRAAGDSPSRCFFGAPSYPYLASATSEGLGLPYLVAEASIDANFFEVMNIRWRSRADQAVVAQWRATVLQSFDGLPWVFSGGEQPYHILLPADGWLTGPDGGETLRSLITRFWNDGTPERIIWGNP